MTAVPSRPSAHRRRISAPLALSWFASAISDALAGSPSPGDPAPGWPACAIACSCIARAWSIVSFMFLNSAIDLPLLVDV